MVFLLELENGLLYVEGLANGVDLIHTQTFALLSNRQIKVLVAGSRLGVFDTVGGALDGSIRAGYHACLDQMITRCW